MTILRFHMYKTVVTDTKLFNRTGDVGRWSMRVATKFEAHAVALAPVNKRGTKSRSTKYPVGLPAYPVGSLKRSIEMSNTRVGPRQIVTEVSANTPYAIYVIKGTGTIRSKSARVPRGEEGAGQFRTLEYGQSGMYLPSNPGYGKGGLRQTVSGQRANNFLGDAYDATARTHPSLRGFKMGG